MPSALPHDITLIGAPIDVGGGTPCRTTGKKLRVLWLDAHADCNNRQCSPAALTALSGQVPALDTDAVHQIGVRCVDPGEVDLVHELGMREVMTRALARVDAQTHRMRASTSTSSTPASPPV